MPSELTNIEEKGNVLKIETRNSNLTPPSPQLTEEQETKLWRKIDRRLMPILSLMYLMSFLDRGNIGNARLQGLVTELGLVGNQYNIALPGFKEIPTTNLATWNNDPMGNNYVSLIFDVPVLSASSHAQDIRTCMGFVKNYPQLVVCRVLLGIAEAGLFPGVAYYLTLWYPRHKLQLRIGIFFGSASLAGAFSGLLAFGISYMSGTQGLLGWSWIFVRITHASLRFPLFRILEGLATVAVGTIAFFVLIDFPHTAKFLSDEERAYLLWRKKYDNSSVGEEESFSVKYIIQALTDWQVYAHALVDMSIMGPLYGITLFLPTIISNFGYSPAISNLLTVPPYVLSTIVLYIFAHFSDKTKKRSPFIYASLIICLVGYLINITDAPHGVKYFGTFLCVTGAYAGPTGVVAWLGNNLSGQSKRAVGMAVQMGIGNFSGAIISNTYRDVDQPRYIIGHGIELMFVGIGLIVVPIIATTYYRLNNKKKATVRQEEEQGVKRTTKEIRAMGDRAPEFIYTL
ncbi:hypothetical protein V5O48_017868 [Marasmius crinis-equi]|uniref:MFS general substrate transporter n=1 Tax=Marasmius crinis-equi TaxID=585013 RepID=A0ABR3EMX5_9AGAR